MNNKGFSLIELLATLVILGVVLGLGVVSVTRFSNTAREKNKEHLVSNIEIAAAKYAFDTKIESVKVGELVTKGYLESDNDANQVLDPVTDQSMNECVVTMRPKGTYFVASLDTSCGGKADTSGYVPIKLKVLQDGSEVDTNNWLKQTDGTIQVIVDDTQSAVNCSSGTCMWTSSSGIDLTGNYKSITVGTSDNDKYRDVIKFSYIKDNKLYSKTIILKINNVAG